MKASTRRRRKQRQRALRLTSRRRAARTLLMLQAGDYELHFFVGVDLATKELRDRTAMVTVQVGLAAQAPVVREVTTLEEFNRLFGSYVP